MAERWGIEAACAASGVSQANIRDWAKRGHLGSKLEPSGRGKVRGYTHENIAEFALLRAAVEAGVPHSIVKNLFLGWNPMLTASFHAGHRVLCWWPGRNAATWMHPDDLAYEEVFREYHSAILIDALPILRRVEEELEKHEPLD